jgi:predicted RNase H-like HicB family nuclease
MTDSGERKPLDYYLGLEYPFNVLADPDGGWVIEFPDLEGCLTQIDSLDELPFMVEDVRRLWIETEYDEGADIPLPSYPEEYSGKFNLRLPRSLHRRLAETAEREGVSLNQHVVALLSQGDALARLECRLAEIEARLAAQPAEVAAAD